MTKGLRLLGLGGEHVLFTVSSPTPFIDEKGVTSGVSGIAEGVGMTPAVGID